MGPRSVREMCRHGGEIACEPCHWGLHWSCRRGHEPCEACAEMTVELHANPTIGAFRGAPYGATKR
eukprot:727720-Pyramimonas_sp.AAC.1